MTGCSPEIPDIDRCLELMAAYHMLPNIKDHSIVVARVAEIITGALIKAGHPLSVDLAVAGALLHDIGKTACLDNDDDHAAKGVEICLAHNLGSIAGIVGEHVILRKYSPGSMFTEKEVVYYADKRVNHDQVVNLEERLRYILERYGMNNIRRCQAIERNYAICRDLEKRMFASLAFEPGDVSEMITTTQTTI